jgi:dolichol-phosphate mannosyltransferase
MVRFVKIKKLIQFGIVGGLMIVLNIGILYILTNILGLYYIISAIISYQILLFLSFTLNDRWTFRSVAHHKLRLKFHRFAAYYAVSLSGMLLNIVILYVLTEFGQIYYLMSSFLATCIVFLWNYLINSAYTWGERDAV